MGFFQCFEEPSHCFPQWLNQFTFPPAVYKSVFFSASAAAFVIYGLFDDSHSDRCAVIAYCGLALFLPDGY